MHIRRNWFLFRQLAIPIIATVFVVGGILLLQNHWKQNRLAKLELNRLIPDTSSISDLDEEEVESLLTRSSSDQLTRLAVDLADEPNQQLAVRLDRIKKRIVILDRILELEPNEQVRNFAISAKLATLMDREFIAAANDLDDDVSPTQLREFAGKHSQSENVSVTNSVAAAFAVAALSEYLDAAASRRRSELVKPAMEQLQITANSTVDDFSVAKRLENWLQLIHSSVDRSQSQMFVDSFVKSYGSSTNDAIAGIASRMRKSFSNPELELVDLRDSVPVNLNETIGQLMIQVDAALQKADVSESMRIFILSRANELLCFGRNDEAQEIRQKIGALPILGASDELDRELARFDQRLKLFMTPFDVSCFADLNSNPAKFKNADAEYKILYFGSAANRNPPLVKLKQLLNALRDDMVMSKLEIMIAYLDDGTEPESLKNIRAFAAQNGRVPVWFLTTTTKEGREFLARVPIDETPYFVVLGKDDRVIALDPPIVVVKEIVLAK